MRRGARLFEARSGASHGSAPASAASPAAAPGARRVLAAPAPASAAASDPAAPASSKHRPAAAPCLVVAGMGAAAAAAALAAAPNVLLDLALYPRKQNALTKVLAKAGAALGSRAGCGPATEAVTPDQAALRDRWLAGTAVERVGLASADGTCGLAGFVYPAARPSRMWAILVHGYRGDHREVEAIGLQYAERGYNVLAPDLRAHGESGGEVIGMGWPDRLDLVRWAQWLAAREGSDIRIVLHGHSMGAATVLMASGEQLPPQVRALVSDCAYTSVHDIFASCISAAVPIPPDPVIALVQAAFRRRGGYDFAAASCLDQVAKDTLPTLFVHGTADTFVPPWMAEPLYRACGASEKHLLMVPGAAHICSQAVDPGRYYGALFPFLARALAK